MTPDRIELIKTIIEGSLFLAIVAAVIFFGWAALELTRENDSNERKN